MVRKIRWPVAKTRFDIIFGLGQPAAAVVILVGYYIVYIVEEDV